MTENVKKPKTRISSIDYGMARIGIAISDETKIIAAPLKTLGTEKKLEKTAAKVIYELKQHQQAFNYELEEIVVGLPLLLNGKSGLITDEVKSFIDQLKSLTSVPIVSWDERLTSVQAERAMREGTMTRRERSKFMDTVSATILLQSYLDYKHLQKDLFR